MSWPRCPTTGRSASGSSTRPTGTAVDAPVSDPQVPAEPDLADAPPPAAAEPVVTTACPVCDTPTNPGDQFCESCGAELSGPPARCRARAPTRTPRRSSSRPAGRRPGRRGRRGCSSTPLTSTAGRWRAPRAAGPSPLTATASSAAPRASRPRDHFVERPAPWVAAVCDRASGTRATRTRWRSRRSPRRRRGRPWSSATGSPSAPTPTSPSLAAARAARDVLAAPPPGTRPLTRRGASLSRARRGGERGGEPVVAATAGPRRTRRRAPSSPASSTPAPLVVGWVGDSRAYWLPDDGRPVQLTVDDSWAAEAIAHGLPRAEAEALPQAHAITRWLGADAPDGPPRTTVVGVGAAGWLRACAPTGCGTTARRPRTSPRSSRRRRSERAARPCRSPRPSSPGPTSRAATTTSRSRSRGAARRRSPSRTASGDQRPTSSRPGRGGADTTVLTEDRGRREKGIGDGGVLRGGLPERVPPRRRHGRARHRAP